MTRNATIAGAVTCAAVLTGSASGAEIEQFPLIDWDDVVFFPIAVSLLPDVEGEIVSTRFDVEIDVPAGTDISTMYLTANVPLVDPVGGDVYVGAVQVTAGELGLSGDGLLTGSFQTDALNGTIATADGPTPPGFWGFEILGDGFYGEGDVSVTLDVAAIPAPFAPAVLGTGVWAVALRRRR